MLLDTRDNTLTNTNLNGTGESVFLLDGSTLIAKDYADLWDGNILHIINITDPLVIEASTATQIILR